MEKKVSFYLQEDETFSFLVKYSHNVIYLKSHYFYNKIKFIFYQKPLN